MPFEVTPFFPRLTRTGTTDNSGISGNAASGTPAPTTAANTKPTN
jgi:hypothetical protein